MSSPCGCSVWLRALQTGLELVHADTPSRARTQHKYTDACSLECNCCNIHVSVLNLHRSCWLQGLIVQRPLVFFFLSSRSFSSDETVHKLRDVVHSSFSMLFVHSLGTMSRAFRRHCIHDDIVLIDVTFLPRLCQTTKSYMLQMLFLCCFVV